MAVHAEVVAHVIFAGGGDAADQQCGELRLGLPGRGGRGGGGENRLGRWLFWRVRAADDRAEGKQREKWKAGHSANLVQPGIGVTRDVARLPNGSKTPQ